MFDKQLEKELKNKFENLQFFEEPHVYEYNGSFTKEKLPSVSSKLSNFYEPFDKNISYFVAKNRGITQEEVLQEWDDKKVKSCEFGTSVHNFAEKYVLQGCKPRNNSELGVVQWWMDLPDYYIPVALELPMYNEQYKYAGTPDIILINNITGNLVLGDYKTNEDLFKNYKSKKLLEPFKNLLDNPFNKYQLQFSHYQMCLEDKGYTVEDRILIWLIEDKENFKFYKQYKTDDLTEELREYYG